MKGVTFFNIIISYFKKQKLVLINSKTQKIRYLNILIKKCTTVTKIYLEYYWIRILKFRSPK
jgi:hypothetical protein